MEQENEQKASIWLKILSFVIPLVGLILFACNISNRPKYAKGCGIAALIGFFTSIILTVVIICSFGLLIYNSATEVMEESNLSQEMVTAFNSKFEMYEGNNVSGIKIKSLRDLVKNHNMIYGQNQITVRFDGIRLNAGLDNVTIYNKKYYKVQMKYDYRTGYINQIDITTKN